MKPGQLIVNRAEDGRPLVEFIAEHLGVSRRKAKDLLDGRNVFVNERRVWMAKHALRTGDRVEVRAGSPHAPRQTEIPLLHRDARVLVADKPAGLLSVGEGSVETLLQRQLGLPGLRAVHRLDRDTTGCLLLAADEETRGTLVAQFEASGVEKTYRALVAGRLAAGTRRIAAALEGQRALTDLRVLQAGDRASYVGLRIATGRTHQIRRHLAGIGHPVLGDRQYFTAPQRDATLRAVPRQMLHAFALSFAHPGTGATLRIEAPIPADFSAALHRLGLG